MSRLVRLSLKLAVFSVGLLTIFLIASPWMCSQILIQPRNSHQQQPEWNCIDRLAGKYRRAEDIFCTVLPEFVPHLKNPCFYDYGLNQEPRLRCLPYFYILGMAKSATTDLYSRLVQHPLVMPNKGVVGKETWYWSRRRYGVLGKNSGERNRSFEEYLDMFVDTAEVIQQDNQPDIINGDATPFDLWDFRLWTAIPQNQGREEPMVLTPHLIKYLYRHRRPKFIIQLREPIKRLYSDYIFIKYGNNTEEFHNHTVQAVQMMNECLRNFSRRICFFSYTLYQQLPVRLHLGCYSVFLQEWLNVFPRDNFLITTMDEYENNMNQTLNRVFKFLELPLLPKTTMAQILNKTRKNVAKNKKDVILPETVAVLRQFYRVCNQETAQMLADPRFLWTETFSEEVTSGSQHPFETSN